MTEESKTEKSAAEDRQLPDWDQMYVKMPVEAMPWYYKDLDPDLENALARHGVTSGEGVLKKA